MTGYVPAGYLDSVPLYADIYVPTRTPRPTWRQRFRWWIGGKRGPRPESNRIMYVVHYFETDDIREIYASHENCAVLLSGELPDDCRNWQVHEIWVASSSNGRASAGQATDATEEGSGMPPAAAHHAMQGDNGAGGGQAERVKFSGGTEGGR